MAVTGLSYQNFDVSRLYSVDFIFVQKIFLDVYYESGPMSNQHDGIMNFT